MRINCYRVYRVLHAAVRKSINNMILTNSIKNSLSAIFLLQEVVKDLAPAVMQELIVELAASGAGSLDYVKDLIFAIKNPEEPIVRDTSEPWCKCGCCVPMKNEEDRKCCGRRICVTSYYTFKKICLDRDVLKMQILARSDMRAEPIEFSTNSYRKAAYQQYALWKYGKLGVGNRRILPACILAIIRKFYPSPDGTYMGFKHH